MKNLDEKKKLAQLARAFGQPDLALEESILKEEQLLGTLFEAKKVAKPVPPPPTPAPPAPTPPPPAPAPVPKPIPVKSNLVQDLQNKELEGVRKSLVELTNRINTLSWGGGGTGVVRIHDTDDFDKTSYGVDKFLKWSEGMFRLDEINPYEMFNNTVEVTSNTYSVNDTDYYIGVNYNGVVHVTLPTTPKTGRIVIVKDESGLAQFHPIHIVGTVDNDTGGAILKINNGAVQLLYRNGWRII